MKSTDRHRRIFFAAAAVLVLVLITWDQFAYAVSSYWADGASRSSLIEFADRAVAADPDSPEARYQRGRILNELGLYREAAEDLDVVLKHRPDDYFAWFELGRSREELGDIQGALEAYRSSSDHALHYGYPRWRYGLMLREVGRNEEGWDQIKLAYASDPRFLIPAVKEAWEESKGDTDATIKRIEPLDDAYALAAAYYLLEKGVGMSVARLFCRSGSLEPDARKQLVDDLIGKAQYTLAAAVESSDCALLETFKRPSVSIRNGDFEKEFPKVPSFLDWQFKPSKDVDISVDDSDTKSLRIKFDGALSTDAPLTQLVPVEPGTSYKLAFRVKTQGIVSGVRPLFSVTDARTNKELARSKPFAPQNNSEAAVRVPADSTDLREWTRLEIEVSVPAGTGAIRLSLTGEPCTYGRCPVFGTVWIDNLEIGKVDGKQ